MFLTGTVGGSGKLKWFVAVLEGQYEQVLVKVTEFNLGSVGMRISCNDCFHLGSVGMRVS